MAVDQTIVPPEQAGEAPSEAEFQEAIASVLADPIMSAEEKKLRLETLRQEFIAPEHVEHEPYGSFESQISDAIAMLAEGGHLYRPIPAEDETN